MKVKLWTIVIAENASENVTFEEPAAMDEFDDLSLSTRVDWNCRSSEPELPVKPDFTKTTMDKHFKHFS